MGIRLAVLFGGVILVGCSSGSATPSTGTGGNTAVSGNGSGGSGGTGNSDPGAALPLVCPLFTQDLAAEISIEPLKAAGTDQVSGAFRYCFYDGSDGTSRVAWGALTANAGSVSDYTNGCLHPTFGDPGQLISGIGTWACFLPATTAGDLQSMSAGNGGPYVAVVSGDAALDALKQAMMAFLAKLPS